MRRITVSLSLCYVSLAACVVSPPDPDEALFACEDNTDCASGFSCRGGFCQRDGESEMTCERVGCPEDRVCVKRQDGAPTCEPRCDAGNTCPGGDGDACVTADGFPVPGEPSTKVRACSSCGGTCAPGTACWPNASGGAFDEISVSCLPGIRCFADADCESASGTRCVADLENAEFGFIGICRPECGACTDLALETCVDLPRFGAGGEVSICVPCPVACGAGEVCTWIDDSTGAVCACDQTQCENRGLSFRCDGDTCTESCSLMSAPCRAGAACDDLDGVCRPDCLAGFLCDQPSACRWTEQPNGDPAYLCMVDACTAACGEPTCVFTPFASVPDCCAQPNCARDSDCGPGRCVTDYQGEGVCRPSCEPGITTCFNNGPCLPQLSRDGLRWVNACALPPDCPDLAGALCVYADRTLESTASVMNACTSTANCPGGSSCVFSPRAPATLEAQPFGVCLQNPSPSCSSPAVARSLALFPGSGTTNVCVHEPTFGEACTGTCGDPMSRCVRMPGGGDQCRPWCSQDELPCLPGESCATLFERGSTAPPLGTTTEVCVPGLGRYEPDSLSTPTWFSTATLPATTSGPWGQYFSGVNPNGPSMHVANGAGGTLIAVNQTSPTPTSKILSSVETPCGQLPANVQIGAGEWSGTGRVVRLVATCPPGATTGVCANGNGAWRIVTARVFGVTAPDNCATAVQVILEPNEELRHGAIGDGYLALVRIRTPGTTPRASIRVGKLVDVRDASPPQVKIVWAPHEILLNRDWKVQELRVTRDLVAWRMDQPQPPESGQIGAASIRQLFAAEPPGVWYSQEALATADHVYEGLAAGEHWVAWTRLNTVNGEQQVHWVAVNLADPSATQATSGFVATDGDYTPGDWITWVRPSIDGNFLAYTTSTASIPEHKIWVINLAKSDERRSVYTQAAPLGWPLVVSDTAGTGLWVYVLGSDFSIAPITVPRP